MNTKIILVGGYPRNAADGGKALCEEMVRGLHEPVKILICLFARPQENWTESFNSDRTFLHTHLPHTQLQCELAEPNQFTQQIKNSHVIYIKGGEAGLFIATVKNMPDWTPALAGKTVAGTSAGAEALFSYYYHVAHRQVEAGLGLIQEKLIPHWEAKESFPLVNWAQAYHELKNHKEPLPIVKLAEGEFVVTGI